MNPGIPYTPPEMDATAFNCPYCQAYADVLWGLAFVRPNGTAGMVEVPDVKFARCGHCMRYSIWDKPSQELVRPRAILADEPNNDLPTEVIDDYREAAKILQDSPRGAAALLRLAIQKLCDSLVDGAGDLNTKIGTLVQGGLDVRVQQALDAVRVVGNEAVHPGQVDLNDTPQMAHQLFKLVNLIGRRMITEPAEVEAIYQALPPEKRAGIEARDKPSTIA